MTRTWWAAIEWACRNLCDLCRRGVPLEARGESVIHFLEPDGDKPAPGSPRVFCPADALTPGLREAWLAACRRHARRSA